MAAVITDSGGIQEETTVPDPVPHHAENTERPVTVTVGTNQLIGRDTELMEHEVARFSTDAARDRSRVVDGKAAERIAGILTA